jgi:hypothetical protein
MLAVELRGTREIRVILYAKEAFFEDRVRRRACGRGYTGRRVAVLITELATSAKTVIRFSWRISASKWGDYAKVELDGLRPEDCSNSLQPANYLWQKESMFYLTF